MAEHLTRAFFEDELSRLSEAYAAENGAQKVFTDVMMRNGVTLRVEGKPTCTDTYVMIDFKQGTQISRAVVPYGSILGVGFSTEGSSGGMGFHR